MIRERRSVLVLRTKGLPKTLLVWSEEWNLIALARRLAAGRLVSHLRHAWREQIVASILKVVA